MVMIIRVLRHDAASGIADTGSIKHAEHKRSTEGSGDYIHAVTRLLPPGTKHRNYQGSS